MREGRGREGFTVQYQKYRYVSFVLWRISEQREEGGMLGSRVMDSWNMTRRFFVFIIW